MHDFYFDALPDIKFPCESDNLQINYLERLSDPLAVKECGEMYDF